MRAGEIECALADLAHPAKAEAEALTDALARAIILADGTGVSRRLTNLRAPDLPESLTVTAPEGFAYYALDPLRYADAVRSFGQSPGFVIGIRSIGTVLSAVCATALRCERITVRPTGHPYDRQLRISVEDRARIRTAVDRSAQFFIVDEGPGLSGSSFLATAEALELEGASRDRIVLVGSHDCDSRNLVARDAVARWQRFRFLSVPPSEPPPDSRPFLDWDWRRESSLPADEWPATWAQLTPPKFVSQDGDLLWKFEGLGRAGDQVRTRARTLAAAGFSPRIVAESHGFTGYSYVKGSPLRPSDWDPQVAQRIAEYLVFRKTSFAATVDAQQLSEMTLHNVSVLLDCELQDFTLDVAAPCVCDARLAPHEWIQTADKRIWKTDATMHGDDHFYPGPCDIAWDIAGAVIEWSLDARAEEKLSSLYVELTADKVHGRVPQYKIAYAAFRAAYARMAANTMPGTAEAERFDRDFNRYMDVLRRQAQPFLRPKKIYSIA